MTYTESTNQAQPLTLEVLNKSIEELNQKSVGMYKTMAMLSYQQVIGVFNVALMFTWKFKLRLIK